MNKIACCMGWVLLSTVLLAQEPLISFHMNDGNIRVFNIREVEEVIYLHRTEDMVMEIFHRDGETDLYPALSITRMAFTSDSLDRDILFVEIFKQAREFPVLQIDSIVFSKLEPKIIDNLLVVDTSNDEGIISVNEDGIILKKGSALASAIKEGHYMACGITPQAPFGFLRKVIGIDVSGDQVIVTTFDADLSEVIEDGVISFSAELFEEDIEKLGLGGLAGEKAMQGSKVHLQYKEDGVEIKGELEYALTMDFHLAIKGFSVRQFLFQYNMSSTFNAITSAEVKQQLTKAKSSLNQFMGIQPYRLKPILVWVGILPVVITSYIDLQYGYDVHVFAKVFQSLTLKNRSLIGMEYHAGHTSGEWKNLSTNKMSYTLSPPGLSLGGKFKVLLGPQINAGFYNMHKAYNKYAGAYSFLELEVDVINDPLWKLYAGVESGAGVKSERFKVLNYTFPYSIKAKTLLAQSTDLIEEISPGAAAMGDTISIKGGGFGSQVTSYVAFKYGASLLPIDMILATDYVNWSSTEIKLVVPHGFPIPPDEDGIDVDLILDLGGFFANKEDFRVLRPGPLIESIQPDTVNIDDVIVITGKRFGEDRGNSVVLFDGITVSEYPFWSENQIKVKVPDDAKSGQLWVEVEEVKSNKVAYVVKGPLIESISQQVIRPGDLLEITGKNFGSSQGNSFVSFGGINASVYEDWSQTTIVVEVPDEIESGQLWVVADGQKSNEVVYGLFTIEVTILPPRIITYEMMQGATEVEHPFEAYALPDSVYRYVWDFNDGNTFSEARSKGQTSKINHRYAGLQNGDLFRPSVAVYDLEDKLLASDNISIAIVEYAGYECNPCTFEVNYDELEKVEDWRSVKYKKKGTNILHGPYMTWHDPERNQMAVCLCYKDGKEDGKYILWYQNGNKEWDRNYLNGVPEGTWIFWYANGNKMREEYYSKGLLYKYVSYYSESGRIASVRFYANNMRHGSHTYWYESGMLMKEEHYKDGELDGVYIEWHENGQKKLERFYKNGKLNGRQTGWDIDGNISWEGDWVDDKQVGIWRYCYLLNCECRNYADGSTGAYVIVPCP